MEDDDCGSDDAYCFRWQILQAGEEDHGDSDGPDDLKERGEEGERPGKADERELE